MFEINDIKIDNEKISGLCKKYRIKKLSIFGSILKKDFRPDSDIDILAEFNADARISFFKLADIQEEIQSLLDNRKVDLVTLKALSPLIKDDVLAEAKVIYAEK